MAVLNEIIKKYTEMGYDELLAKAKNDFELLLPIFNKISQDGNGRPYVTIFMGTALAADGKLTDEEYRFMHELTGIGREEAETAVAKHGSEKAVALADRIFDICNSDLKKLLFDFCMCFVAVDKEVAATEREFLTRLLIDEAQE